MYFHMLFVEIVSEIVIHDLLMPKRMKMRDTRGKIIKGNIRVYQAI